MLDNLWSVSDQNGRSLLLIQMVLTFLYWGKHRKRNAHLGTGNKLQHFLLVFIIKLIRMCLIIDFGPIKADARNNHMGKYKCTLEYGCRLSLTNSIRKKCMSRDPDSFSFFSQYALCTLILLHSENFNSNTRDERGKKWFLFVQPLVRCILNQHIGTHDVRVSCNTINARRDKSNDGAPNFLWSLFLLMFFFCSLCCF